MNKYFQYVIVRTIEVTHADDIKAEDINTLIIDNAITVDVDPMQIRVEEIPSRLVVEPPDLTIDAHDYF